MPSPAPLVRVMRSGLEESVHLGHVAVCDARGRLLASAGDPSHVVYARSSMKPVQAAVSLRAIGEALPDRLVAIMCGSHGGEDVHVAAVRALLRRAGVPAVALRCPPAYPFDRRTMARGTRPRRLTHNCSGKHAGMLFACIREGWDPATYVDPAHPLQRRVLSAVEEVTDLRRVHVGVDGCGVPVHAMPLASIATLFARLSRPERFGGLAPEVARCIGAMRAEPYLLAGRGTLDTALTGGVPGVVSKIGAEALSCAAVLEPGIGVAVKVEDGGERACGPVMLRVLSLLGVVPDGGLEALDRFARPWVTGGGAKVGEFVTEVQLRRHRR